MSDYRESRRAFKNNLKVFEIILSIMMASGAVIPIALQGSDGMLKICMYMTYLCAIMIFAVVLSTARNSKSVVITICLVALMLFSLMVSGRRYTLNQLGGLLNIVCLQFTILACRVMPSNRSLMKRFALFNMGVSCYYILLYFTNYETWDGFRTYGFGNPNQTAIFLMLSALLLVITMKLWDTRSMKVFNLVLLASLVLLVYYTGSRSCLISILICVFLAATNRRVLPKWLVVAIVLLPLFFVFVYTALYNAGRYLELTILGKPLFSGRERYYQRVFQELHNHFLFGNFAEYQMGNLHNGYLAIIASFGIPAFFVYVYNTIVHLFTIRSRIDNRMSYVAMIAILATFFQMVSETMVTTGNYSVMIYIGMYYYIASYCEEKECVSTSQKINQRESRYYE